MKAQLMLVYIAVMGSLLVAGDETDLSSEIESAKSSAFAVDLKEKQPSSQRQHIRLARSMVLDLGGFLQPMVAGTMFVPFGWQEKGGIVWSQEHACTNGFNVSWQAESDDGLSAVALLPQRMWQWSSNGQSIKPACPMWQLTDAESYVRAYVEKLLPEARIIYVRQRQDIEKDAAHLVGEKYIATTRIKTTVSAAEAFFEFEKDGVPLRGSLVAGIEFNLMISGGQYTPVVETLTGYATPAFASYGPAKTYNHALYEGLRRSYLPNPAWEAEIARHNSTMSRIALKGIQDRIAIQNQSNADISNIINQTWQNQQVSSDRRAREFIEYIRDVETYDDPHSPGGQVQLNSFYDQAWSLADGTYVLTNDPSFQPDQYFGISGQQLSVSK